MSRGLERQSDRIPLHRPLLEKLAFTAGFLRLRTDNVRMSRGLERQSDRISLHRPPSESPHNYAGFRVLGRKKSACGSWAGAPVRSNHSSPTTFRKAHFYSELFAFQISRKEELGYQTSKTALNSIFNALNQNSHPTFSLCEICVILNPRSLSNSRTFPFPTRCRLPTTTK